MSGRTDRYEFVFDMMAAKNLRKPLTVQIFTADNVQVSCDLTISIEDAAAKAIATGISQNETQLYYAMMNYSDAAAAFFGA